MYFQKIRIANEQCFGYKNMFRSLLISEQNTYSRRYLMAWQKKTRQFGTEELAMLEGTTAEELASSLLISMSVVALRALAEVMLNGDEEKLQKLLANEELTAHWKQYQRDPFIDERDHKYAYLLVQKLQQNTPA